MKLKKNFVAATMLAGAATVMSFMSAGAAQAPITIYCSILEEQCRVGVSAFEKATGAKATMVRKSTGETLAQIRAEASNPRADVWWGGPGDSHIQAAEEGLTVEYKSPKISELHDWAQRFAEQAKYRATGTYLGALGIGYNTKVLESRGLPEPKCWADLLDPGGTVPRWRCRFRECDRRQGHDGAQEHRRDAGADQG